MFHSTKKYAFLCGAVCIVLGLGVIAVHAQNPDHVKQLLETRNCAGCDLQNAQIVRANLNNANLTGANLSGAFLYGTTLHNAALKNANFDGANLEGADLRGAIYDKVALTSAADYTSARRVRPFADLGVDMARVLSDHAKWISSSGYSGAQARLSELDLTEFNFAKAHLSAAQLDYCVLAGVDFSGAELLMTNFAYADLREANLARANLRGANLRRATLIRADLRNTDFGAMDHVGTADSQWPADLELAKLCGANLGSAKLRGARLVGADLTAADLTDVDLSGADLENANLSEAITKGLNLSGANLKNVRGLTSL